MAAIAAICEREHVWLHVDAAYAGVAAMVPGYEWILDGAARADSLVVNPHKWLFTPFDLSALYCRRMDVLRQAFSLTPEYLKTSEGEAGVRNLMDTGIQLGRRFRALKLWMILRHFGAEGLRAHLAEHMRLARLFASWIDTSGTSNSPRPCPSALSASACAATGATAIISACWTRSTDRARSFSRTPSSTGATCCVSPSATCTRPSPTCAAPGNC